LHGGEFAIRSRIGEGTRVTVRLPLDCERVQAAKSAAAAQAGEMVSSLPAKFAPQVAGIMTARKSLHALPVKKSA
jgi:hypothetical protein